jgi:hypothetical protein
MPEFAAWSHENLARFAEESYVRLREQQDALEQATANFKDAMCELRKLTTRSVQSADNPPRT